MQVPFSYQVIHAHIIHSERHHANKAGGVGCALYSGHTPEGLLKFCYADGIQLGHICNCYRDPKWNQMQVSVFHYIELHWFWNLCVNLVPCTWYEKRNSHARFLKLLVWIKFLKICLVAAPVPATQINLSNPKMHTDPSSWGTVNNILCSSSAVLLLRYTCINSEHLNYPSMKPTASRKETLTCEVFQISIGCVTAEK